MTPPTCPICDKPTSHQDAPFCSRGCASRDLLQWLGDGYRIPGSPAHDDGVDSVKTAD